MEIKILPKRFRSCRPWKKDSNLTVIFNWKDVINLDDKVLETLTQSTYAQYTDSHSLLGEIMHTDISTADLLNLVTTGLARFDNMFLFHDMKDPKKKITNVSKITNSVYSSYNLVLDIIDQKKQNYANILIFVEKTLLFLEKIEAIDTLCNCYILIVRSFYILIIYFNGAKIDDTKINQILTMIKNFTVKISKIFNHHENLENNVDFLTLRLYQIISLIQCNYLINLKGEKKPSFLKLFKEFKLLYKTLLMESYKQNLPSHILTNDNEVEVIPHLDILNDYICALLEEFTEITIIDVSRVLEHDEIKASNMFVWLTGGDFKSKIYDIAKKKILEKILITPPNGITRDISDRIFELLVDFYYQVYKGTYFGNSDPDHKVKVIVDSASNSGDANNNNAIPVLLKNVASNDKDHKAFFKLFGNSLTRKFTDQTIYESNFKPFLKLQIDLVRLLQNEKTFKDMIGKDLLNKFRVYDNEDIVQACKVNLVSSNSDNFIEYIYFSGKRIIKFDTKSYDSYEYKVVCLEKDNDIPEGNIYRVSSSSKESIEDAELTKLYNNGNFLKGLSFFSPFENIFSIEEQENKENKGNKYYLRNTELHVIIYDGKTKIVVSNESNIDEIWEIKDVPLINTTLAEKVNNICSFLLKLTNNKKVKYLFISTQIQDGEKLAVLQDDFYQKHKITIPQALSWKQKFLRNRGHTYLLPGKKTGSMICNEPSELLSNPYLFHHYSKYSILHFFNEHYNSKYLINYLKSNLKIIENHPHLELWYLYMNTVAIQYKECWDDLSFSMKIISQQAQQEEEKLCFKNFKNKFLQFVFAKNVFPDTYKESQVSYLQLDSFVPSCFEIVQFEMLQRTFNKSYEDEKGTIYTDSNLVDGKYTKWGVIISTLQKLSGNVLDKQRIKKQLEIMKTILINNIIGENRCIYEIPMGFGKTSSLLPCIVYSCFSEKMKKGVVIVPYHLVNVVKSQLNIFNLYFPKRVKIELNLVELNLVKSDHEFHITICSDYDYKSFIVDNPGSHHAFDIVIVDEVDSLFDNIKTDFFKSNSSKRVADVFDKIEVLDSMYINLKETYGFNGVLKCLYLNDLTDVTSFLTKSGNYEAHLKTTWFFPFIEVLLTVNTMRYNLHYGLANDNKRFFAVPYMNAKTPSPTNQFSNPDMVFVLTYLSYLYCEDSDLEYVVKEYNLNESIKDVFGRSTLSSGLYGKITLTMERSKIVKFLMLFIFESNFEYSDEMMYTSMIDATSSFYTKKLIGFSGTITLKNPIRDTEQKTFVEYMDITDNLNKKKVYSIPYDYSEYKQCKENKVLNKQLCFLNKIEILTNQDTTEEKNIIYLDIGDIYLYEKIDQNIRKGIVNQLNNKTDPEKYEFYKFKNGKIGKCELRSVNPSSRIIFYDHLNCRGTDYKFPSGKYCIIISISLRESGTTLKSDNSFSEFLQALYRVRQLNEYFNNESEEFIRHKEKNNEIEKIYIKFNDSKIGSEVKKVHEVVDLLLNNEKESFSERKAYAKNQYNHFLLNHFTPADLKTKIVIDGGEVLDTITSLTKITDKKSYILKLKDISSIKAISENKNQIQNKNNLDIPKNGSSEAFDISIMEEGGLTKIEISTSSPPPFLSNQKYAMSKFHTINDNLFDLNTIFISIQSSKSVSDTINFCTQDLIYYMTIEKIQGKPFYRIFILPFVFLRYIKQSHTSKKTTYHVCTMFGKILSFYYKENQDQRIDVYNLIYETIRLFNNLVPYKMEAPTLKLLKADKYIFDRLVNIDYLYPFNMIYYEDEEIGKQIFDENTFPPLKPLSYREFFDPKKVPDYNDKKYDKYKYLTSTKTSGTSFLPEKSKVDPYFQAVKQFCKMPKLKVEDFYEEFLKFRTSYESRMCIDIANEIQPESCSIKIQTVSNTQKCLFDKLNLSEKPIISRTDNTELTFQKFSEEKWKDVINSEDKFSLDIHRRDLLAHLLSQYKNHVETGVDHLDCASISLMKTSTSFELQNLTDNVTNEKEKQYLNNLVEHIKTLNENIISDCEMLPQVDKEFKSEFKISISDLKGITEISPTDINKLNKLIVRYLYQYKIEEKFQNYYAEAFEELKTKQEIKVLFSTSQLFFKEFKFTKFMNNADPNQNKDINNYSLETIQNFFEEIGNKLDNGLIQYLKNNEISPVVRNFIFDRLVDERWKLTCTKTKQLYNNLNKYSRRAKNFQEITKYFENLNSEFDKKTDAIYDDESKLNDYGGNYKLIANPIVDPIYQNTLNFANKTKCSEMKHMLKALLSMVTVDDSKTSQTQNSETSHPKPNYNHAQALGLGAAATLAVGAIGLLHLNKKHKLTQKVKDYLQSRWSKKRVTTEDLEEEEDERQHHLKKNQDVVKNSSPPKKPVQTKQPKQRQGNPKSSPKKTIGIKNPSVQKNTRKKLAQQ